MTDSGSSGDGSAFLRQLAAGTAHDLNNLLLVVIGCAELALEDPALTSGSRKLMHDILASSARAAALTRQFLVLGRPLALPAAPIDVAALLKSAESLLRLMLGDHITLQLAAGDAPLWVRSGASQLEQVIVNLALNARDAMPRGGHLRVSAAAVAAARIQLTISDTGQGIDPAVRERMFEPYATTKGDASHSGLGLAVVRTIVDQLDGAIHVTSTPGQGTTFVIDLPAAQLG